MVKGWCVSYLKDILTKFHDSLWDGHHWRTFLGVVVWFVSFVNMWNTLDDEVVNSSGESTLSLVTSVILKPKWCSCGSVEQTNLSISKTSPNHLQLLHIQDQNGDISCITAFSVASKINCHSVEGNGSSDKSKSAVVTCFRFLVCSSCTNYRADRKNVGEKVLKLLADGIIYKVT